VGATSNCLWWALNGVSLQFACSKCGTTVRESPYTDTILFGPISVSDFRKFKCTTHKFFHECVVSHTLKECVGNATRRQKKESRGVAAPSVEEDTYTQVCLHVRKHVYVHRTCMHVYNVTMYGVRGWVFNACIHIYVELNC